ncbi:hypothetical protein [Streptomyces sp. NPDC055036]
MITGATIDTSFGDESKAAPYISIEFVGVPEGLGGSLTTEQRQAIIDAMAGAALPLIPDALGYVQTTTLDCTSSSVALRPSA